MTAFPSRSEWCVRARKNFTATLPGVCAAERRRLLDRESTREVSVADGRKLSVPYVGPLKVTFGGRLCYVGALVFGDEVLLGAVPMEDMDLVVNPGRREVTVDPASPNVPHSRAKRAPGAAPRDGPATAG